MEELTTNFQKARPDKNVVDIAWHWFDLTCPFCYVSKSRNGMLEENGFNLIALPFQAHPDVPAEGIYMGERKGPMYEMIEKEAIKTNLPLNWPVRLPNSRYALAMAEQVRRHLPELFPDVKARLYAAHFSLNEDLGSKDVVNNCLKELGVEEWRITQWLETGVAFRDLDTAQYSATRAGVAGTPAWIVNRQLISGLQSPAYFQQVMRL